MYSTIQSPKGAVAEQSSAKKIVLAGISIGVGMASLCAAVSFAAAPTQTVQLHTVAPTGLQPIASTMSGFQQNRIPVAQRTNMAAVPAPYGVEASEFPMHENVMFANVQAQSGPQSFFWRLKVGSALFVVATVCIEAARHVFGGRPLAMAAHTGIKSTTALRAESGEGTPAVAEIEDVIEKERQEKLRKIQELKEQEKFMRLGTGTYECQDCGFKYEAKAGDPEYPIAPGTQFADLPEDWSCPVCGAPKGKFETDGVEVSGFEVNQGYGLGTNAMTSGQKSLLIYGSLIVFFGLFLSGYSLN
jgi:rubredoxin